MIELKMTTEFFEDIFTPGVMTPHICTKGLPKNAKFFGIGTKIEHGMTFIIAQFDDGKTKISHPQIEFEAVLPE